MVYKYFLAGVFLFFIGAMIGWCIEVLFRRFFTAKKWINPGFLTGPYLPLYGFGTVGLFAISNIPIHTGIAAVDAIIIILIMGVAMTLIEYIAGLIFIKGMNIKLWDYSDRWGNIQGLICPLFSLFWLLIGVFFYFVLAEPLLKMTSWFENNISFAFFVGIVLGVFAVDVAHSFHLCARIRRFAKNHQVVVHFEKLKETIYDKIKEVGDAHPGFLLPFKRLENLKDQLTNVKEKFSVEVRKKKDKQPENKQ